jgi:serine/threonine-protein kinase RsbW
MSAPLEVTFAAELQAVAGVGERLQALCAAAGVGADEAGEIELAVVEAVNNTIEHAYAFAPGREIQLAAEIHGGWLTARISDSGRSMPAGLLDSVPASMDFDPAAIADLPEGGMGLVLIKQLMDRVDYQTLEGRNTFTLARRLRSVAPSNGGEGH